MTCKNVKPMLLYVENKNFIKSDFIEEQSFRKSESELSICSINNSFTIHANGENGNHINHNNKYLRVLFNRKLTQATLI